MARQLYISSNSPLHRLYVHRPALTIRNRKASTIEQARFYVSMCQDRSLLLAEDLLLDPILCDRPGEIRPWFKYVGYQTSAALVFSAGDIYQDLLLYLVDRGDNAVADAIYNIIADYDVNQLDVVSCSGKDYVFSCGLREHAARNTEIQVLPGFDIYGIILGRVIRKVASRVLVPVFGIDRLLTSFVRFGYAATKTVLVLSDSFMRQMVEIESGSVVPISGGRFRDLVRKCEGDRTLRFSRFHYVVIHAGINDVQRSKSVQRQSWVRMERYLEDNIASGFPASRIMVSLPIPHPSVVGVDLYSAWIRHRLEPMGVNYIDWCSMEVNPFGTTDGYPYIRLLDDGFHLCHAGVRELWIQWCRVFPELKTVRMELSPVNYAQRNSGESDEGLFSLPA